MGRSRTPVPQSARYYELAQWLRSLRRRSGLTYRQMSELSESVRFTGPGCSAVTLSRADRGTFLPRQHVVEAYAQVCGATRREARLRWERAAQQAGAAGGGRETPPMARPGRRLELVYQPAHLLEAMHRVRLAAGQPSLREMQKRARDLGTGPLPRSTVADVLAGVRMPSEELLVAYVRACGQHGHHLTLWRHAWARALGSDAA
ncbi:helix-turn-helix transcriptional regulator [Streptomyces sp. NBC_00038]|uniref:helix-turn-helix domain-containing protein n=1 Tax=Streptomyces sp. NBC_00038 TaxID=2903615 RepID=UPI0022589D0E|nr:helix-turn-helix transcriptional regulator [Streptomyces sp. NBC_00038]MCX5555810.1 helix-turn-helix domain-containing protein [Streptomyces sp. NBC_00038]